MVLLVGTANFEPRSGPPKPTPSNFSFEDLIRREQLLWVFLSRGEVLVVVDHLHTFSYCVIIIYVLVVV